MATWPGTLPTFAEFLHDSYRETAPDNVIRTQMSIGPDKIRKRGTAAPTICQGIMYMTTAQVATFRTFYDSTINYGADEFDTIHPRTGAAVSVAFIGQPMTAPRGTEWNVSMAFEILP